MTIRETRAYKYKPTNASVFQGTQDEWMSASVIKNVN
jgi:hypothetical protein